MHYHDRIKSKSWLGLFSVLKRMKNEDWWKLGKSIQECCFFFNQQKSTKVELDMLHAEEGKNLLEHSKKGNKVGPILKEDSLSFMDFNRGLLKTIPKKLQMYVILLEWEEIDKRKVKIFSYFVKLENWPDGTSTRGLE